MKAKNLDAYIVYHFDYHQSEYLAPCDERIAFISGFTGSNGICLIVRNDDPAQEKALMWTDGRYFLQGEKQLYDGWKMMKIGIDPAGPEWIPANLPKGSRIGVDRYQVPSKIFKERKAHFEGHGFAIEAVDNLVDQVWGANQPLMPQEKVWILEDKFSGETT